MKDDCPKCGAWILFNTASHSCAPLWLVWCPYSYQDEANARKIRASDARAAAENWAHEDDHSSAEYRIVGGQDATVCVKAVDSDKVQRFIVSGEAVPSYTARAVV